MKFNGSEAYFLTPTNKYGLSKVEPKNITEDNFTYLARLTIDWDKMNKDDLTKEGGIVVKNGMHCGLMAFRDHKNMCYIRGCIWVTGPDGLPMLIDRCIEVQDTQKVFELSFTHIKSEKRIIIGDQGFFLDRIYEGDIVDYSSSWFWVACCNALESCDEEHRNYLRADINMVGIFGKALSETEILNVFKENKVNESLNPVGFFDFKKQTPYKVYDESKNGNNLVKFDNAWFDNVQ